ncbi:hypothetical protein JCM10207_005749 [Rhodosporidiobolus poonsookiae]
MPDNTRHLGLPIKLYVHPRYSEDAQWRSLASHFPVKGRKQSDKDCIVAFRAYLQQHWGTMGGGDVQNHFSQAASELGDLRELVRQNPIEQARLDWAAEARGLGRIPHSKITTSFLHIGNSVGLQILRNADFREAYEAFRDGTERWWDGCSYGEQRSGELFLLVCQSHAEQRPHSVLNFLPTPEEFKAVCDCGQNGALAGTAPRDSSQPQNRSPPRVSSRRLSSPGFN